MTNTTALRISAFLAALAIALGAFGAHGLKTVLANNNTAAIWEKAVFYHLIHAVVLFVLAGRSPLHVSPWRVFLVGIGLFSGSLYILALTNLRWLGAITPLGGVSFLVGWIWLLIAPNSKSKMTND